MSTSSAHENDGPTPRAGEAGPDLDALQARLDALRDDVADADKRLRAFVRERPFVAVGAAVAVGFLVGRLLRRL